MRAPFVVLLALPAGVGAQLCDAPSVPTAVSAPVAPAPPSASRDLYCLTLVPAPGLDMASGQIELGRGPGPFTVSVTADGRPVVTPVATIAGLPAPSTLGHYTTYVAWGAAPTMYPVVKLGRVGNGRTRLRGLAIDPFVVLVTAERSERVTAPAGRVVLRGGSPSTRLQPPDLMQFTVGAIRDSASDTSDNMARMSGSTMAVSSTDSDVTRSGVARWSSVPMQPGLTMVPGEMSLRPAAVPYLPRLPTGDSLPEGRPRRRIELADGDTLRLSAGLVGRTIAGRRITMYAFNGQYPGPLISVGQGATIVVDFTNRLDQPTTVHWHGLRLDNAFDGAAGVTQDPVPPGGRFIYRVRFPDAGIYWYHPHVREESEQNLGLFANILVRPASGEAGAAARANRDEVLMLDDLLIGDDGLVPFGRDAATHALMGRFGNVFLVNGERGYTLDVSRGEIVRFLFTNVSNARTYNLSFPGARMKIVGSDGGAFEREEWIESLVIAPAERYVVAVRFERPGTVALVTRVRGLDHFFNRFFFECDTLGLVRVSTVQVNPDLGRGFHVLHTDRATSIAVARYRRDIDRPVDRTLVLAVDTRDLPFVTRQLMQLDSAYFPPVEWSGTMPGMNWAATTDQVRWVLRDPKTGRENMDIGWRFKRGDRIKLRIINERRSIHGMQHPVHLHGQRFLVLAVNGVPSANLVWKDTVLVPAGAAVDLLLDLSNPGRWMLHCHIAEHLAAQMMTAFTVR